MGYRTTAVVEHGIGAQFVERDEDGIHRQRHVGAGVPIWNREHVEPVDLVDPVFQRSGCGCDQGSKGRLCGHVRSVWYQVTSEP